MARKQKAQWEYGDFQTPPALALAATSALSRLGVRPNSVIEPTCGRGAFLMAAAQIFPEAWRFIGVDINEKYLAALTEEVSGLQARSDIELIQGDFFSFDWSALLAQLSDPVLVLGNPPWVTSSELSILASDNVPEKSNFQERRGYDAMTGKSNFDISEWMILRHFEWLRGRAGIIALLCKTAIARKVLAHAWKHDLPFTRAMIFAIDAKRHFDAAVDACFLVIDMSGSGGAADCLIYDDFDTPNPTGAIGYRDGLAISDVALYERWRRLKGDNDDYVWRSGIKHDCAKVMELVAEAGCYRNGLGAFVSLEGDHVYPMLKSSDIGNGEICYGRKCMLLTQRYVGEDTDAIKKRAPKTWKYLEAHEEFFSKRASAIYRQRPRFSIFGVGDYSFAPWKVAISGFYKQLEFKAVEPYEGKPVVFDDTVYFLACWSASEARFLEGLLNSEPAQQFFRSMIFWADKRPITAEILKRLDLHALSVELNSEADYRHFAQQRKDRNAAKHLSFDVAESLVKFSAN